MEKREVIKAIIIDDEKSSREAISGIVKLVADDVEIVGEAANVKDGISLIHNSSFEILFLDIDLPDGTGFNVIENIPNLNFNVIFTTAHNDHALKAFRYSAIDYLLKPIDPDELIEALNKVRRKEKLKNMNSKIELLYENYNQKKFEKISIPTKDGFEIVSIQDITQFSAENNYTNVHLKNGRKILVTRTIKVYDDLLSSSGFMRTHQSHLVNLLSITKYTNGDGGYVTLSDNSVVDVARRKKDSLLKLLKNLH